MDENRVEGTARNVKGKIQEDIGSLAGNARMRAEGLANQAGGAAQDLYGQAADATRDTAVTVDRWLRLYRLRGARRFPDWSGATPCAARGADCLGER
jgi:uncharacterized protein YjbJ (UPF0337 family)